MFLGLDRPFVSAFGQQVPTRSCSCAIGQQCQWHGQMRRRSGCTWGGVQEG
ncbi:hypothetical protein Hanom_Chr02g00130171 [Helianthus anomalus]